jgi:hypothetical protein
MAIAEQSHFRRDNRVHTTNAVLQWVAVGGDRRKLIINAVIIAFIPRWWNHGHRCLRCLHRGTGFIDCCRRESAARKSCTNHTIFTAIAECGRLMAIIWCRSFVWMPVSNKFDYEPSNIWRQQNAVSVTQRVSTHTNRDNAGFRKAPLSTGRWTGVIYQA